MLDFRHVHSCMLERAILSQVLSVCVTVFTPQVTRAFSFTKTPKRVIQRAFMANSTPDDKSPGPSSENMSRVGSSATLSVSSSNHLLSSPSLEQGLSNQVKRLKGHITSQKEVNRAMAEETYVI